VQKALFQIEDFLNLRKAIKNKHSKIAIIAPSNRSSNYLRANFRVANNLIVCLVATRQFALFVLKYSIDGRVRIGGHTDTIYSYSGAQSICFRRSAFIIGNRILSNLRNKKFSCYYRNNLSFLYNYYNIVELAHNVVYLTIVLIFVFFLRLLFSAATILYYKRYYLNNRYYCLYLLISSLFFLFFFEPDRV